MFSQVCVCPKVGYPSLWSPIPLGSVPSVRFVAGGGGDTSVSPVARGGGISIRPVAGGGEPQSGPRTGVAPRQDKGTLLQDKVPPWTGQGYPSSCCEAEGLSWMKN